MNYLLFSEAERSSYPICFLVPSILKHEIQKEYITPFGLDLEEILVLDLHYSQTSKKTSVTEIKNYLIEELVPVLKDAGVKYIAVADSEYFKVLTKTSKVDINLGYVLDSEFGDFKVVYVPSYRTVWRDPEKVRAKIAQGINALTAHRTGSYEKPGTGIIHFEYYPQTVEEIADALEKLLEVDQPLSIDIETFSLKPHTAGIGTISFAWSKHEGIAFAVDRTNDFPASVVTASEAAEHSYKVRQLLKNFFERLKHKTIYHHIGFDAMVLIYQLYMDDITDTEGLLRGMDVLLKDWDCTKLIAYLATNSCAGNKLSLKDLAQEFAGNYAMGENIKDITKIPLPTLLRYNLVDCLSTWHVREKHWPTLIQDQQLDIYEKLFKPSTLDIIQMQLTGLPVDMNRVKVVKKIFQDDEQKAIADIQNSSIAQAYVYRLNEKWVEKKNATLKKKRVTLADAKEVFNPNSDPQLQELLYEVLGLPVIAYTDSKQPSTKADVLKDLKNHTEDPQILSFLDSLLDLSAVSILLATFIPALENAIPSKDGWHYLCGNFNLGGTLSGRLSSSDPNLQNLPAGADPTVKKGKYGKLIKSCIVAPRGKIFLGLDFNALEDRISALTTKDPEKLKVYTDGYDGHSLRAFAYYTEQMPDIDPSSVESINSIQIKYKSLRAKSKNPTFTLTYQGTWNTLVVKYKFTPELAKLVEARYHELYKVSDQWVADRLNQAAKDGYVTVAFGLRVRTPLLAQVIRGNRSTPREAEAEGRSAGNALGQSWCLLNSRACNEFMGRVRKEQYRLSIRPCAQIHDAQYYLVDDDPAVVAYVNKHLVNAVKWQDHLDIWHDEVKLGGEVSIFWPDWSKEIVIPNGAGEEEIIKLIEEELAK